MKRFGLLGLALVLLSGLAVAGAQSSPYDKYLTIEDIQNVGKLTGLKTVPYDPSKGAGGDLNFALADGTMVLIASFQTLDQKDYEKYKTQMKNYIKGSVPGIGEDAFSGPANDPQFYIGFRKGTWVVTLSSFFNPDPAKKGATFLSMDQIAELAKIVIGRL